MGKKSIIRLLFITFLFTILILGINYLLYIIPSAAVSIISCMAFTYIMIFLFVLMVNSDRIWKWITKE